MFTMVKSDTKLPKQINHRWIILITKSSTAGMFDQGFPGGSEVKASACKAGDLGSTPGSGRSSGEGNGSPLQYSCLENPMDRGAWQATSPLGRKELDHD